MADQLKEKHVYLLQISLTTRWAEEAYCRL